MLPFPEDVIVLSLHTKILSIEKYTSLDLLLPTLYKDTSLTFLNLPSPYISSYIRHSV